MKVSLVSLAEFYLRLCFSWAGLRFHTVSIDSVTTMNCWVSSSLYSPLSHDNHNNPDDHNKNHSKKSHTKVKPVLILLHGFGPLPIWQWYYQVRPLSKHFDLIVPHLIFFGGSTTKSPARSELFQAQSIVKLLRALGLGVGEISDHDGGININIVGFSYGGFVGYHVARLLGKDRIKKVVIVASDLLKTEPDFKALLERAGVQNLSDLLIPKEPPNARLLMKLAFHHPLNFLPTFVLRDAIKVMYGDNIEQKTELLKGMYLRKKDELQPTPLQQEVLLIWGEQDQMLLLEKAHHMQKWLGEKAKLKVLKNTSHLAQFEDPTSFNEVLLSFLLAS